MIEVTHHDLYRLVKHLEISADRLIKLYTSFDLNDDNSDDDWIRLSYGKRKIGLKKKRNGACIFLSKNRRCTAYEARPMSCRIFPIDIVLDEDNKIIDLEISDVLHEKFINCKHFYCKANSYKRFRLTAIRSRNESEYYWKKVAQWNELPEKGRKRDFLNFLGL